MHLAEIGALVDLWVAAWRETIPEIDFGARRGLIEGFLRHPAHATFVAETTSLLGFVSLEGEYLHQLVVAPGAQGSGVARLLLEIAKRLAPIGLTLDVNQANKRAVRFYEREGFAVTQAGHNPGSGLATWRMRWPRP